MEPHEVQIYSRETLSRVDMARVPVQELPLNCLHIKFGLPIATGLIGDPELPSVIRGKIITHDRSTLSLDNAFKLKFSRV